MLDGPSFRLADDIGYITRPGGEHVRRVVIIGQLALFCAETGEAWTIDREDHLALGSPEGDPEPFHLKETATSFAIDSEGALPHRRRSRDRPGEKVGLKRQRLRTLVSEKEIEVIE